MMRVLLIEDNESAQYYFERLIARLSQKISLDIKVDCVSYYEEAMKIAETGSYPLAVVDLDIPNPYVGAGEERGKFLGLKVIPELRRFNKDILIGVYTSYFNETSREIVDTKIDKLLDKSYSYEGLLERLETLVTYTLKSFNYTIDIDVEEALGYAFSEGEELDKRDQYELCLRRILCDAEEEIVYNSVGNGRSGAAIAAVYIGARLPKILKLGRYSKLEDELDRYNRFVSGYIAKRGQTSKTELAQAGEVGILAYSFVGMEHKPITLAQAVNQYPPKNIANALSEHFEVNYSRWFSQGGVAKPYDLASWCRKHFKSDSEKIRQLFSVETIQSAVKQVAGYIGPACTDSELTKAVTDAIAKRRSRILCKPEAIVHGDLNANNLIWSGEDVLMIDFAKTGEGPRIIDFVTLEASIKFDVPTVFEPHLSDEDKLSAILAFEDMLLNLSQEDSRDILEGLVEGLGRKSTLIKTIRTCALNQCGSEPQIEYYLALFFATVKYLEKLASHVTEDSDKYTPFIHALFSSYRLATFQDGRYPPLLPQGYAIKAEEERDIEIMRRAFTEALQGPKLDNFIGFIAARFTDDQGHPLLLSEEGLPQVKVKQTCKLVVSIQTVKPDGENFEQISVLDGNDVDKVKFVVEWVSDSLDVDTPARQILSIMPAQETQVESSFGFTPSVRQTHTIYVYVYQKGQFIQAIEARLEAS